MNHNVGAAQILRCLMGYRSPFEGPHRASEKKECLVPHWMALHSDPELSFDRPCFWPDAFRGGDLRLRTGTRDEQRVAQGQLTANSKHCDTNFQFVKISRGDNGSFPARDLLGAPPDWLLENAVPDVFLQLFMNLASMKVARVPMNTREFV
jgi:hypothetical protein